MIDGNTQVDISDVLEGLDRMQRAGKDLRPIWKEVRPMLGTDIRHHFTSRSAPDGGWPGYSAKTLDRLRRKGGKRAVWKGPLTEAQDARHRRSKRYTYVSGKRKGSFNKRGLKRIDNMLGRLRTAFKFEVTRTSLAAISLADWSSVHQEGGIAGRGSRLPRRTFMWASDRLIETVRDKLVKHVTEAM